MQFPLCCSFTKDGLKTVIISQPSAFQWSSVKLLCYNDRMGKVDAAGLLDELRFPQESQPKCQKFSGRRRALLLFLTPYRAMDLWTELLIFYHRDADLAWKLNRQREALPIQGGEEFHIKYGWTAGALSVWWTTTEFGTFVIYMLMCSSPMCWVFSCRAVFSTSALSLPFIGRLPTHMWCFYEGSQQVIGCPALRKSHSIEITEEGASAVIIIGAEKEKKTQSFSYNDRLVMLIHCTWQPFTTIQHQRDAGGSSQVTYSWCICVINVWINETYYAATLLIWHVIRTF